MIWRGVAILNSLQTLYKCKVIQGYMKGECYVLGKVLLVGLSAYAIYKECTMTKKEKIDYAKRQVLTNPYLNPTGCFSSRDGVNVNK